MKKVVEVFFSQKKSRIGYGVLWPKDDVQSFHEILSILEKHAPTLYRKFSILKGEDLSDSEPVKMMKDFTTAVRRQVTQEKREKGIIKKKLDRPHAGRKPPNQNVIINILERTNNYEEFCKMHYEELQHSVSKSTYHRYKRQFTIK